MTPKVSVIVPVYNAEKYLRKTLDSLRVQTMPEFEVIMINDGSNDLSAAICDEYVAADFRFRVIHKQNAGVSSARQDGLDAAVGEYIIHTDSDDWVEPIMLDELYKKAKEDDADIVICDYYINDGFSQARRRQQPIALDHKSMLHNLFHGLTGSCWNKLIRRSSLLKYQVRFPKNINYCEDKHTLIQLFIHDVKTSYLSKAFYHYFANPESITRKYTRKQYEEQQSFLDDISTLLPKPEFDADLRKERFDLFLHGFIYKVLSKSEIKYTIRLYGCSGYYYLGTRWKLGYLFLQLGFSEIAHRLIKY